MNLIYLFAQVNGEGYKNIKNKYVTHKGNGKWFTKYIFATPYNYHNSLHKIHIVCITVRFSSVQYPYFS